MTKFLDSPALVKLYVPEEFAESIRALDGPLLCCVLAHVEVPAAFWRQSRTGAISPDLARAARNEGLLQLP